MPIVQIKFSEYHHEPLLKDFSPVNAFERNEDKLRPASHYTTVGLPANRDHRRGSRPYMYMHGFFQVCFCVGSQARSYYIYGLFSSKLA